MRGPGERGEIGAMKFKIVLSSGMAGRGPAPALGTPEKVREATRSFQEAMRPHLERIRVSRLKSLEKSYTYFLD
jgi:hypothetical protein